MQTGEKYDCTTCENNPPAILPTNRSTWRLYQAAASQLRVGIDGPIGFDLPAVLQIAEILGIEATPGLLLRLRAIESCLTRKGGEKTEKH